MLSYRLYSNVRRISPQASHFIERSVLDNLLFSVLLNCLLLFCDDFWVSFKGIIH